MTYLFTGPWYNIAKTEYRITLNSLSPRIKSYFLPLVLGVILFYPTIITPWILRSLFTTSDLKLVSTFFSLLFDVFLLNLFLVFLIMPISLSIKDIKIGNLELLLSAPVKSSDVLVGEFFGKLPFYMLGAITLGGFVTGVLAVTRTNLGIIILLTLLFVVNFLVAYWIGTAIGFYLKIILSKSAKMKDLGKALSFILIIPWMFVMYGTMGISMNYFDTNEFNFDLKGLLNIFPSSWIGEISRQIIVMNTISDILNYDFFLNLILIIFLIVLSIILGSKLANRNFNLEPTSFSESEVRPHSMGYKFFKLVGGNGSFGIILASNYKNYIRRFENLSKLVYSVVLMFALIVFFNNMSLDSEFSYILAQVLSGLLGGFVISEMTMQGKEKFLLYRQSPLGDWKFIFSKLLMYFIIIMPIVVIYNILISFMIVDLTISGFVNNIIAISFVSLSIIILSMGIFLINPPFSEKAPEFMMNFQVILISCVFTFFAMLISLKDLTFLEIQIIHSSLVFCLGLILLLMGKRKLAQME